jgi:hypothetical protein
VGLVLCPGVCESGTVPRCVWVWYCVQVCKCGSGTVSRCVSMGLVLCPGV